MEIKCLGEKQERVRKIKWKKPVYEAYIHYTYTQGAGQGWGQGEGNTDLQEHEGDKTS